MLQGSRRQCKKKTRREATKRPGGAVINLIQQHSTGALAQ